MRPDHLGLNKISAASAYMDTAALYQKGLANVTAQITPAYSANKELMAKAVRLQAANWRSQATINQAAISQEAIVQAASRNMQTALSQAVRIDMRLAPIIQDNIKAVTKAVAQSVIDYQKLAMPPLVLKSVPNLTEYVFSDSLHAEQQYRDGKSNPEERATVKNWHLNASSKQTNSNDYVSQGYSSTNHNRENGQGNENFRVQIIHQLSTGKFWTIFGTILSALSYYQLDQGYKEAAVGTLLAIASAYYFTRND
ncbi:hypothetical protein [Lacticaseibacillus sp. 53-4]|uniref:hypothetical protein n=1 Tax=Lacticaseibacillus sp. 53-4 TaxID=2799575 RepID=UPI00194445F3|nr:hypothetical protein [Lacticaseibacillus sp. 53-4]